MLKERHYKMKQILFIVLTLTLVYSCTDNKSQTKKQNTEEIEVNSSTQPDNEETILNSELADVFEKAVHVFPDDSASLYRFYFLRNSTNDKDNIKNKIERIENLISNESIEKYRNIETNLKPLMSRIINSKTISNSQSDSLVTLYSDYDYFSGESLFSYLLTNDENYDLVWSSFRIMAQESRKDTCLISGLITLDNNIRTNAELAEAMQDFTVQAIRNNPIGFLDMYNLRDEKQRNILASYIAIWDTPDKELIETYTEISKSSDNDTYKKLATELIEKYKE